MYVYDSSLEVRNVVHSFYIAFLLTIVYFLFFAYFFGRKRICDFDVYKLIYENSNNEILIMTMSREFECLRPDPHAKNRELDGLTKEQEIQEAVAKVIGIDYGDLLSVTIFKTKGTTSEMSSPSECWRVPHNDLRTGGVRWVGMSRRWTRIDSRSIFESSQRPSLLGMEEPQVLARLKS